MRPISGGGGVELTAAKSVPLMEAGARSQARGWRRTSPATTNEMVHTTAHRVVNRLGSRGQLEEKLGRARMEPTCHSRTA